MQDKLKRELKDRKIGVLVNSDNTISDIHKKICSICKYTSMQYYNNVGCLVSNKETLPDVVIIPEKTESSTACCIIKEINKIDIQYRPFIVIMTNKLSENDEIQYIKNGVKEFIYFDDSDDIIVTKLIKVIEEKMTLTKLINKLEESIDKSNRSRKHVENIHKQLLKTLAYVIDAKDSYTSGHSVRVAELSKMIADKAKIKLNNEFGITIYEIGLLHDIGKIGVPDSILTKKSKLTDDEFEIVCQHTIIGYKILSNMNELPEILDGARYHHEKYNGTGYPDGLKGEEIPEVARIIAVADAYDAMTSNRSYRGVMDQCEVREQIVNGMGTQFDPNFARIMLDIIDEDKDYKLKGSEHVSYEEDMSEFIEVEDSKAQRLLSRILGTAKKNANSIDKHK